MPALPHVAKRPLALEERKAISLKNQAAALQRRAVQLRSAGDADMAGHVEAQAAEKTAEAEGELRIARIREREAAWWRGDRPYQNFAED